MVVLAACVLLFGCAGLCLATISLNRYDGIINVWDWGALIGAGAFGLTAVLAWLRVRGTTVLAWLAVLTGSPFCLWLGYPAATATSATRSAWLLTAVLGWLALLLSAVLLTLPAARRG